LSTSKCPTAEQVDVVRDDGTVVTRLDLADARLLAACGHGRLLPTEYGGLVLLIEDEGDVDDEFVCNA
jgi:hypothetical protein